MMRMRARKGFPGLLGIALVGVMLSTQSAVAQVYPFFADFELDGIDGHVYRLDDFRGSVTMVNFFFPT